MNNASQRQVTVLEKLADFIHGIAYTDLPEPVIARAKDLMADSLGCAFGALSSEPGSAVIKFAQDCGGLEQSTLIAGTKTSAPLATLVNGTLLRYLDNNDYYFGRDPAHPSGNLAVVMAVAERQKSSGAELLATLIAAYELHIRLADYAGIPSLWKRGWHHGTNLQFSCAAAAGKLSWCDAHRTAHAMAIAASHGNTLAQLQSGKVSMIKASAEAWVAKGAVEAAMLASYGMTGPLDLMEGRHGWASVVAGEVDAAHLTSPVQHGMYRILDVCAKPYPVVATAIAPVGAAIELHEKNSFDVACIDRVIVYLPRFALTSPSADPGRRHPTSIESAQHSFYYCTAVALLDGACGPEQFTNKRMQDAALHSLLDKVVLMGDENLDAGWPSAAGAAVHVCLGDGKVHICRHDFPLGHPKRPLDAAALAKKFLNYAVPVLSSSRAHALLDAIYCIEDCRDVREFTALLAR
ncbi:MmgE/PrpD family protein [Allopusillimonas soli]|uniref:MmgE/PrpD family protein n=1 Tax=Allopusillimonas soli TaxID=659016 RepID=A0A853FD91_9BURK|nr:MmgE/PrpD family protein [Allopusillimonas soli]NYT36501.1 MmgE/PrpD family protein [Allopusillimonas soli]